MNPHLLRKHLVVRREQRRGTRQGERSGSRGDRLRACARLGRRSELNELPVGDLAPLSDTSTQSRWRNGNNEKIFNNSRYPCDNVDNEDYIR